MKTREVYAFATDALAEAATKDPECVAVRLFFDEDVRVLTTRQCYEAAQAVYLRAPNVRRKGRTVFSAMFERVVIVEVDPDETTRLMQEYSLDEPSASLLAALAVIAPKGERRRPDRYLVTANPSLLVAAAKEGISVYDYSEKQFCAKYGS